MGSNAHGIFCGYFIIDMRYSDTSKNYNVGAYKFYFGILMIAKLVLYVLWAETDTEIPVVLLQ